MAFLKNNIMKCAGALILLRSFKCQAQAESDVDSILESIESIRPPGDNVQPFSPDEFMTTSGNDTPELPPIQCDPSYPKIVPRKPSYSEKGTNGASYDPESRNHPSMATSRPRRLHRTFLQYQILLSRIPQPLSLLPLGAVENIINTQASADNSWIVASTPINVPKYSRQLVGSGERNHIGLNVPEEEDGQLPNIYRTYVNYGDNHPFEGAEKVLGMTYQPLRIDFYTDELPLTPRNLAKVETLTGDVFPSVAGIWAAALSVVRAVDNIFISSSAKCGEAMIPSIHSNEGVSNADILIYVTADGPHCYDENGNLAGIDSYAHVCTFDQHMRPISGNLVLCLDQIDATRFEVSEEEVLRITSTVTMEIGKILGLSPALFRYFRDPQNGKPWGATKQNVICVDGSEQTHLIPNILRSSFDLGNANRHDEAAIFYEVISPTVRQVVRNHFDCQRLGGARLDTLGSSSCFGDYFDSRYHFDEHLTQSGFSEDMAYSLSPLTLALLEDSSWYRADFSKSTVPLFGRGAGCGFVENNCVSESGDILEYSRGFFCNNIVWNKNSVEKLQPTGCDYTHNHKADCNFSEWLDRPNNKNKNPGHGSTDCPMRTANIVSCSDESNAATCDGETFSSNSRCFETNTLNSVCLESYCNSVDSKLDIVVNGKVYQCDYEGQEVDLGHGYTIRCPRLSVVCPHLVCPANCSGKGVCDYCQEVPHCVCDNPFDDTPGCWGGL
ncbi:hypothetical protein ACHAXS_011251 [Conticribra weissflogii]